MREPASLQLLPQLGRQRFDALPGEAPKDLLLACLFELAGLTALILSRLTLKMPKDRPRLHRSASGSNGDAHFE